MRLIVCVDDKGGVSFNHRRQSRDRILNQKILEMVGERNLYLSPYSESLFPKSKNIIVSEEYLTVASEGDFCFVEREELSEKDILIEEVIMVKWNRVYPRDKVLKLDFKAFRLKEVFSFAGSSHEEISVEVYAKIR